VAYKYDVFKKFFLAKINFLNDLIFYFKLGYTISILCNMLNGFKESLRISIQFYPDPLR
jgi:hypothetical protein